MKKISYIISSILILCLILTACGKNSNITDKNTSSQSKISTNNQTKISTDENKDLIVEKIIMSFDNNVPIKITIKGTDIPNFNIYNPDGNIVDLNDSSLVTKFIGDNSSVIQINNPMKGQYLLKYSNYYENKLTVTSEYVIPELIVYVDSSTKNDISFHIEGANSFFGSYDVVAVRYTNNEKSFTQMASGEINSTTCNLNIDSKNLIDGDYYYIVNVYYSLNGDKYQIFNNGETFSININK